jgi:FixJ family two-component response regulator
MPGMTGSELAETIRNEKPDLPIIIATGFAELAKDEGTQYPKLSKPFFQHDLVEAISATLETARKQAVAK